MRIAVVIPALNEAARIEQTIRAVAAQPGPVEILVADGGSSDDTVARASTLARVVTCPPGRARQMNRGAAETKGDVLFFLHADTLPPPDALPSIRSTLTDPEAEAGAFRLSFDLNRPLLRFYSWCTHFPVRHLCFGDRGLFVRRAVFEAIGGFPDVPMFEDLEIVRLLHRRGGFHFLPQTVVTAARRFEQHGAFRQQLRNTHLWLHYLAGTDPNRLTHLYHYGASEEPH